MRARSRYFSFLSFAIASDAALGGVFVLTAFPMRLRSWCFSFLSFVIASDVALGGVVAEGVVARDVISGEDGSDDMALMDINRLEGALMEVQS